MLPGRVITFNLSGFSPSELNYEVDLKKAMELGMLPEVHLESPAVSRKLLQSYAVTYLKEEIQAESLTRNLQGFARFLKVIAASTGQIVDFSKLATKSKVSRSSLIRYTEILEDTLIAERVPVFLEASNADTIKHPKIYFFDSGVLNALLGNFKASSDRNGLLFEQFIYMILKNSAATKDLDHEISFFRTRHGLEVDFIFRVRGKTWALEAKYGRANSSDTKSLRKFKEYYPKIDHLVVVTSGRERRLIDGVWILGWQELLKKMKL